MRYWIYSPLGVSAGKVAGITFIAGVTFLQAVAIEAVLTFFLMTAVFGTAVDRRAPKLGGLAIGLVLTMDISLSRDCDVKLATYKPIRSDEV